MPAQAGIQTYGFQILDPRVGTPPEDDVCLRKPAEDDGLLLRFDTPLSAPGGEGLGVRWFERKA